MPGIGGSTIYAPGTPYNGMPFAAALGQAAQKAQAGDPADLQMLKKLPQFQGFGWQGLLAMAGIMGGGALASAIGATGGAGATAASSTDAAATAAEPGAADLAAGAAAAAAKGGSTAATSLFGGSGSLFSRLFPTFLSSGLSLLGGVIGSGAAKDAASAQAQAALAAAQLQYKAGQDSLAFQRDVFNQQQKNVQPWLDAGGAALKSIADINANPYVLPTAEEALKAPGLQFQLQTGQKALESWERANGTLLSGKAAKDINTFAQGTAEQGYGNLVNEQLAARNANLNPLLSIAGLGQVSSGNLNSNLTSAANINANTLQTTAQGVGNAQQNAAQATASGYVGGANSWLSALQGIGNNIMNSQTIAQIMAAMRGNNFAPATS